MYFVAVFFMFTVFLLSYSLNSHESLEELKKAARTFVNNFLFSQTPTGDSVTQKKNTTHVFFSLVQPCWDLFICNVTFQFLW